MPIRIRIEKVLGSIWADEDDFAQMSDAEIRVLLQEDLYELLHGAKYAVIREGMHYTFESVGGREDPYTTTCFDYAEQYVKKHKLRGFVTLDSEGQPRTMLWDFTDDTSVYYRHTRAYGPPRGVK